MAMQLIPVLTYFNTKGLSNDSPKLLVYNVFTKKVLVGSSDQNYGFLNRRSQVQFLSGVLQVFGI